MGNIIALTLCVCFWSAWAFSLQTLAAKTDTPNGWYGWVPFLNVILALQIARKPMWWLMLLMIPLLNIVAITLVFMALCDSVDKPKWVGIMTLIPVIGWFVLPYLAIAGEEQIV